MFQLVPRDPEAAYHYPTVPNCFGSLWYKNLAINNKKKLAFASAGERNSCKRIFAAS